MTITTQFAPHDKVVGMWREGKRTILAMNLTVDSVRVTLSANGEWQELYRVSHPDKSLEWIEAEHLYADISLALATVGETTG